MRPSEPVCNLCGGQRFKIREEAEPPFKLLQCLDCGLVFVHPFPETAGLSEHYDESYYKEWMGVQKEKRIGMWEKRLKRLETHCPKGRLLDVGCGNGAFLELAQKSGWTVTGTEYSPYAAGYVKDNLVPDVFQGELFDAGYKDASFDAVTMWHVLEHVTDPKRYLKEVCRLLKPSGLLLLAVPNVNDYVMQAAYTVARFRRPRLFSAHDREVHLFHFSARTIKALVEAAGFSCAGIGPDNGIVQPVKKIINLVASIPYYLFGIKVFNAIEVHAVKNSDERSS